jgi:hypothetical protein
MPYSEAQAMFEGWGDYFFMLGSSAAALIGLMFVVVTLTAGRDRREVEGGKRLYTSPVVWHLAVVLVVSAGAIVPTMVPRLFGAATGALALLGVWVGGRSAIGIGRTRMSGADTFFDIWWYGLIPAAVYVGLGGAAAGIFTGQQWGTDAVAAALIALLLVSIHAEWDLVTFLAPMAADGARRKRES